MGKALVDYLDNSLKYDPPDHIWSTLQMEIDLWRKNNVFWLKLNKCFAGWEE